MSASQFPPLQSRPSSKHCTNCSSKMALYSLPGHYDSTVDIDVCMACNAIWFDQFESIQLSPDGTVALFQLIHQGGGTGSGASIKFSEGLRCVTCGDGMKLTNDQVKGTRFSYQACSKGHGRFTTFYNFLAEKQFVRELTKAERAKLAATVQQLRCSGCGAAVNIGKVDACEYCRAPMSVFDRDAAKKAIDHYLQERQKQRPVAVSDRREGGRSSGNQWNSYDRADLGSDILYALGRAAMRIGPGTARTAPVGAGVAGGAMADSVASDVLPSATDVLFGGAGSTAGEIAGNVSEGFGSEIAGVFSDAASSGLSESVASVASDSGSSALESVAESGADIAGGIASSAGEGIVDLVTDGIGSLLGALFD